MPHKVAAHAERCANARAAATVARKVVAAVDGPFSNSTLGSYAGHDAVEICFNDNTANNHFRQRCVHRLKVEDEVELADVLEQPVERLDINLDQVDQGERGLGGCRDDDKVECGIVAVSDEGGRVGGGVGTAGRARGRCQERRQGQEVAGTRWPVGDEGEDFRDEALLYARVLEREVC